MTQLLDSATSRSWYREPWPWLLMAGPLVVVVAGFATLWLAASTDDGLVADDYYKRGLAINQTLARARNAQRLGLSAQVTLGADARRVRVLLDGAGTPAGALRLRFVHPTRVVADQTVELHAISTGVYEGALATPIAGRRVLLLEDAARTWRISTETADVAAHPVVLTAGE